MLPRARDICRVFVAHVVNLSALDELQIENRTYGETPGRTPATASDEITPQHSQKSRVTRFVPIVSMVFETNRI